MGNLGDLYLTFLEQSPAEQPEGTAADIFSRSNFDALEKAIEEVTKAGKKKTTITA